jgi:hypothetical protein
VSDWTTASQSLRRQRCARRAFAWAPAFGVALTVVVLVMTGAGVLPAQVRPDSVQRGDSVRIGVTIPPQDSVALDSIARARQRQRADSLSRVQEGDTVRPPVARFEMPRNFETTGRLRLVGDSILATGAMNLADLLDRVPGVTTYRSGWLAGIHAASFNGDASRIRLFLDGVELDAIEPRNGTALDLTDVQLWTLDELVIERAAGEVRVWMRTRSSTSTTPATRVDIFTGDLNTNAFRGFLAKRWRNGMALQFAGQQIATQTGRISAFGGPEGGQRLRSDGETQVFMGRVGWTRGLLSVDAFANAVSRQRDAHTPRTGFDPLPSYKGQRREGYLRVGYGDTTTGLWAQGLASALRSRLEGQGEVEPRDPSDSTPLVERDTIRGQTQHVLAVGYRGDWWQASLTNRMRPQNGSLRQAPALRLAATWWRLDVGAWLERNGRDSTHRSDLFARVRPLSWLAFTAGRSSRTSDDSTFRPSSGTVRAEAAVRWRDLWLGGGVLRDDATVYDNITLLAAPQALLSASAATGSMVTVHGRVYKDLRVDVQSIVWNTAQFNRAKSQTRAEVALVSEWRRKFPRGQFGFNARLIYDRREGVPFFYGSDTDGTLDVRVTEPAQVLTGLLEIRIQRGTLFYQYRNLTGGQYEQIRGITMPPAVQMYGVRWEFFN